MPTVLEGNCKGENEVASTVKHGGISDSSLTWRLPTMDIGTTACRRKTLKVKLRQKSRIESIP